MKKRKAFSFLLCLLLALVLLSSCNLRPLQVMTDIQISDSSLAVKEYLRSLYKPYEKTEEEIKTSWELSLTYLNNHTAQKFPDVDTEHRLEKEETLYGDVYTLSGENYENIVLYIHGGAWVWEIEALHVEFCDLLADTLNAKVYIPIYPLAPEAGYEQTYQMVTAVYKELLKQNKPIIVMGDSAGGTIALGLTQHLVKEKSQLPSKVVVMAPCADLSFTNPDIAAVEASDVMLTRYECLESAKLWAKGEDLTSADISPLYGSFKGFPDVMLFLGDCDILYPDNLKMVDKMCDARVNVTVVKGKGFWHVFPIFDIQERGKCLSLISSFCGQ